MQKGEEIYTEQLRINKKINKSLLEKIEVLKDYLSAQGFSFPYGVGCLYGHNTFLDACDGEILKVNSRYLYSFSTLGKVQKEYFGSRTDVLSNHEALKNKCLKYSDNYFPLSKVKKGIMKGCRNFIWFSPSNIPNSPELPNFLYKNGLPNDWIMSADPIVIRCDTRLLSQTKIRRPTAIDGFNSPIFLPSESNNMPLALNLNIHTTFKGGNIELVVREIPMESLGVKPLDPEYLRPTNLNNQNFLENGELQNALLDLYKSN